MTVASVVVIGCVQVDLVVTPVVELPPSGATQFVDQMGMRAGGAGANAALALVEAGITPRLIGCVGDDPLGRFMLDELRPSGLTGELTVVPGEPTGLTVACEAPGRDRTFLTYLGVNATWDLPAIPLDAFASDHALFCDYFCAPALQGEPTRELMATTRGAGGSTYFDTAWDPGGWSAETRAELQDLLPFVDVFLPNEAEVHGISGVSDSVERAARVLQSISGGWVVVKLGARGCLAVGPDGGQLFAPAPAVPIADSTGAGDAFNAGLVAALADGHGLDAALRAATSLASTIASRPSNARYGHPLRQEDTR